MINADSNPVVQNDLLYIASQGRDWSFLTAAKILISGGSGMLGSYMVKTFLTLNDIYSLGLNVFCIARSTDSVQSRLSDFITHPSLSVFIHDVSAPFPVDIPGADIIIHSASQASPKYYGIDPVGTLMANTAGTASMLKHAVAHKSNRFMFFSSGEVYGLPSNPGLPVTESDYGFVDPMQVRSCYAESKRMGETMCVSWAHQFGLHASVVRPFHTYGPGMALNDGRVFADFVADVVRGQDIILKSDGLAKRPLCYIADATLGFLTVLLNGKSGEAYNVANPNTEISIRDLAYTLAGLFPDRGIGVGFDVKPQDGSYMKSPIQQSCPSISKIAELGWSPHIGIEEGFGRTIQSYLK